MYNIDVRLRPVFDLDVLVFVGAVRRSVLVVGGDGGSSSGCVDVSVGENSGRNRPESVTLRDPEEHAVASVNVAVS